VQFLIDTATDSAIELYKIGRFLCDQFETVPVPASPAPIGLMTPLPQFPGTSDDVVSESDPEVDFDDEGNVKSITVSTELPPAPPPVPQTLGEIIAPHPADEMFLPARFPAPPGPAVPAELDKRGMPWDARIHAANRSQTIKGEWKSKRGVDANLVAACEAQNKPGNVPTPIIAMPATVSAVAPATTAALAPPPPSVPMAAATAPTVPPPPPVVPMAGIAAPAAVAPSASIDFRGLMQKIQAASAAGKLTPAQINTALAGVGLKPEEMAQLINNTPLIASVNAAIEACLT